MTPTTRTPKLGEEFSEACSWRLVERLVSYAGCFLSIPTLPKDMAGNGIGVGSFCACGRRRRHLDRQMMTVFFWAMNLAVLGQIQFETEGGSSSCF